MNNENDEYNEDRLYYEGLSENVTAPIEKKNSLPKVVEQYVKDAADMSKYNEIPAATEVGHPLPKREEDHGEGGRVQLPLQSNVLNHWKSREGDDHAG